MRPSVNSYEMIAKPCQPGAEEADHDQYQTDGSYHQEPSSNEFSLPDLPQRLHRFEPLPLIGHIFLATFAILFIALGATAVALNGKSISRTGDIAQQAISLSPTVFPILFTAILGKFFRALGLYLAERGVQLGILERLVGSQSLFATIERQVFLRGHYILGASMMCIWALSPLGGQSALRLLSISAKTASSNDSIRYLSVIASTRLPQMAGTNAILTSWLSYAPIYMMAVSSSRLQKDSTQDMFGNLKIPILNSSEINTERGWIPIDYNREVHYSSLLGIPIAGLPASGNASFDIVSRYFTTECTSVEYWSNSSFFIDSDSVGFGVWESGTTFMIQVANLPSSNESSTSLATFNITSMNDRNLKNCSFVSCSLQYQDVESSVFCADRSCRVNAIRNYPTDEGTKTPPIQLFVYNTLSTMGSITSRGSIGWKRFTSTMTEKWIQDPFTDPLRTKSFVNISQLPLSTISRNFGILYNTYWQSTYDPQYVFGNLTKEMAQSDILFNTSSVIVSQAAGKKYDCNMTFAALLIAVSCLLLLAEVASMILKSITLAPDIIGYVSSFMRNSPFTDMNHPSYMDGLEMARAMRNMKITLGDIRPDSDTGYIALTTMRQVGHLRRDRLYH